MKNVTWFNSRTAIIVAGILLTGYLVLILAVTNVGQSRLKESQNNALYLKVLNYTDNLSFFFDVAKEHITHFSNDRSINNYFLNRAAGMSLKYGLGASLFNLKQQLKHDIEINKLDEHKVFKRLVVLGIGGTIIADTESGVPLDFDSSPLKKGDLTRPKIVTVQGKNGPRIYLIKNIFSQNKLVAALIAQINNEVLIHKLTSQEHQSNHSCLKLVTDSSDILVWNSLEKIPNISDYPHYFSITSEPIHFEVPIVGTPFKLLSWFEPVTQRDIFTSAWFIVAISLLAFSVLWGLLYLLKVNNANLVLKTQIDVSAFEQQKLAIQNELLQDEIKKRKSSENKLAYQANHDELTGLSNRSYSIKRMQAAIDNAKRLDSLVLVMFLDLDNFKHVNDTLGHHAGDALLQNISARLQGAVRHSDTVARFGGDEFLLITPNIPSKEAAISIGNKILTVFDMPFTIEQQEFIVSTSMGLSLYPLDGDTPEVLIKNADTALYRIKEEGRNDFGFYNATMNQDAKRKLDLNIRLYQAIALKKISVFYQPIYDLYTKKIVAAEALMRWFDDEFGDIPPDEFIPIAEKNGLIHKLGDLILKEACLQTYEWQKISPIKIAVNFSSVQFRDCVDLQNKIIEVIEETGLPANKLNIEVTESLLIEPNEALVSMIANLKKRGIELSIDDFGTGYSSLSYLHQFAFSTLKIDRSFIHNLSQNQADGALVSAIIAMAKSLKLKVIAEGIEDEFQVHFLKQHGCILGQGYRFSRPIPADAFSQLLMKENSEVQSLA